MFVITAYEVRFVLNGTTISSLYSTAALADKRAQEARSCGDQGVSDVQVFLSVTCIHGDADTLDMSRVGQ